MRMVWYNRNLLHDKDWIFTCCAGSRKRESSEPDSIWYQVPVVPSGCDSLPTIWNREVPISVRSDAVCERMERSRCCKVSVKTAWPPTTLGFLGLEVATV